MISFVAADSYAADNYGNALAITVEPIGQYISFYGITTTEEANHLFNDLPDIGIDAVIIKYNGDID